MRILGMINLLLVAIFTALFGEWLDQHPWIEQIFMYLFAAALTFAFVIILFWLLERLFPFE